MKDKVQLFEDKQVRSAWDEENEEWYFSLADVAGLLSESTNPAAYWRKLKERLRKEGNETVTNCHALKLMSVDGKKRLTDVGTVADVLRLIQSIPSPRAEPLKQWLATVGAERIDEEIDPQRAIDRARETYQKKGYSDAWIKTRIQGIQARNELTNEWKTHGVQDRQYAILTNILHQGTFGIGVKTHKALKGLKKENLRDNMTPVESALTTLAEVSATEITRAKNPQSMDENKAIAEESGSIARRARIDIERQTGRRVVSAANAKTMLESELSNPSDIEMIPNKKQ